MIQIWIIHKATQNYEKFMEQTSRCPWSNSTVLFRQVLSTSKAGDSIASLGSLLQHLTTLEVNLSFPYPIIRSLEPVSTDFHTLPFSRISLFHLYC